MPEFTNTMQNKENLPAHLTVCLINTARNYLGTIQFFYKIIKAKARSILPMPAPGFFVGSTLSIQHNKNDTGKAIRSWQTLIESIFGEA
jgi:hypothetical protein